MPLRIVYFGTPQFAVPTLERLIESRHEVVAVVCQPDKPSGRGRKMASPPVKVAAEAHGIPVLQPSSVRTPEFLEQLAELAPDVAAVIAYGKILPKSVLDLPKHGCLNVHGSILPAYRGAGPIQWAIVKGEETTGITIMQMDEGMDTGAMISKMEVPILEDDTTASLGNLLSLCGAELLEQTLDKLEKEGKLDAEPQDESLATHAPLIKREDARIDWSKSAEEIHCAVRGFYPWPKTFTTLKGEELKITGVDACDPSWVPATAFDPRIEPGTVVDIFKTRGFVVRTGGERGVLLITRVQPPGKPEMGGIDFVNGGGLEIGAHLG